MYQYYTVEIKKSHAGEFEHDVNWFWDEDVVKAQRKAESKYHEILQRAAVSGETNENHAAIIFSSEGFPVAYQCYRHETPEETTEYTEES